MPRFDSIRMRSVAIAKIQVFLGIFTDLELLTKGSRNEGESSHWML